MVGTSRPVSRLLTADVPKDALEPLWHQYTCCTAAAWSNHCFQSMGHTGIDCSILDARMQPYFNIYISTLLKPNTCQHGQWPLKWIKSSDICTLVYVVTVSGHLS